MTQYFIRYAANEQHHECDAARGYSFAYYQFAATPEELLAEYLGIDEVTEDDIDRYNVAPTSDGQYGFALAGLCGYGPFESIEDAREAARNGSYGSYDVAGIYEGYEAGVDDDCNVLFKPTRLVETFSTGRF